LLGLLRKYSDEKGDYNALICFKNQQNQQLLKTK
jgi:hypothetical protein